MLNSTVYAQLNINHPVYAQLNINILHTSSRSAHTKPVDIQGAIELIRIESTVIYMAETNDHSTNSSHNPSQTNQDAEPTMQSCPPLATKRHLETKGPTIPLHTCLLGTCRPRAMCRRGQQTTRNSHHVLPHPASSLRWVQK